MNEETAQPVAFWNNFIRALEAEPQETEALAGASGIPHRVLALGLDRSRRRMIVVSGEGDTRAASFLQTDLQSVFQPIQLIVTRPSTERDGSLGPDLRAGLCPFRLDHFSPDEMELIGGGHDLEAVKDLFRRTHLFQYFFPAPDHLALGLIESGRASALPQLIDYLVRTPDLGHPFGPMELMTPKLSFTEMVKELQNLGLVKDGEAGFELTEEGMTARAAVRDRPREALLFKTLNRISANLYLKSLLHPDLRTRRA